MYTIMKVILGFMIGILSFEVYGQTLNNPIVEQWYLGAGVGSGYTHCSSCGQYSGGTKDNNVVVDLHGGYQFNSFVAAEASFAWLPTINHSESNQSTTYYPTQSSLAVKGILPLTNLFSLYGKLGGALTGISDNSNASTGTIGIYYALGGGLQINQNLRMNLSANYVQANNFDTRFYTIYGLATLDYLF